MSRSRKHDRRAKRGASDIVDICEIDAVEICESDHVASPIFMMGGRNGRWKDSDIQKVPEPQL